MVTLDRAAAVGAGTAQASGGAAKPPVTAQAAERAGHAISSQEFGLLLANAKRLYPEKLALAEKDPARHLEGGFSTVAVAAVAALSQASSPRAAELRGAIATLCAYVGVLDRASRQRDLSADERGDFQNIGLIAAYVLQEVASTATDAQISAFMNAMGRLA